MNYSERIFKMLDVKPNFIQFPIDFLSWKDEEPYCIAEMKTEGE